MSGAARLTAGRIDGIWLDPPKGEEPASGVPDNADTALVARRSSESTRPSMPSSRRWAMTFLVIAVLLTFFSFIVFSGLIRSDWLYGTYGQIDQTQWDEIDHVRLELIGLGIAPDAVAALDDALLQPRPSTEDVIFDLRKAVTVLDQLPDSATACAVKDRLSALIGQIRPGHASPSTPWATPRMRPPQY